MALILYCEDYPALNKSVTMLLEASMPEHEIVSSVSLDDAVRKIHQRVHELQVVITDGALGRDESGKRVYACHLVKRLNELGYDGKVIRFSAGPLPKSKRHVFHADISKYEQESIDKIVDSVRKYLES